MILSYDSKIKIKKSLHPRKRYFGVELEVSIDSFLNSNNTSKTGIEDYSKKIYKDFHKYNFIFKWDSSVPHGFEIVSYPLTLKEHYSIWKNLIPILNQNEFVSYSAPCSGMHVHVSKRGLTNFQISKVINFIYNKDNYKLIKKVAQRHEKNQASFKHKRKWRDYRPYLYDRHTAVNICQDTIEFRLFKGTLSYHAFCKNLEFCEALINFCSPSLYSAKECLNWWNFINYVRLYKKDYPNLYDYCNNRQMVYQEDWNKHLKELEQNKKDSEINKNGEKMVVV